MSSRLSCYDENTKYVLFRLSCHSYITGLCNLGLLVTIFAFTILVYIIKSSGYNCNTSACYLGHLVTITLSGYVILAVLL